MSLPIHSLPEWLNAATENLSAPAKERIKLEIESHFQQAMESHCAEGLTEHEAQTRALTELGNAQAAARSFRKTHLTEKEANALKIELSRYRSVLVQLGLPGLWLLFFVIVFYFLKSDHIPLILTGVVAIIILTFQWISLWAVRRLVSRFHVRLFFTLQMLVCIGLITLFSFFLKWELYNFIFIAVPSIRTLGSLRRWFKLQKVDDFERSRLLKGTVS
jgi:hypothetical protein